jgi:hypothetical protein
MLIGHIRRNRKGGGGRGPGDLPPVDPTRTPPPPVTSRDDVRAEADLRAQGVEARQPRRKAMTPAMALREIEDEIASDPGLIGRPQVRWARMLMATSSLRNLDGSVVTASGGPSKGQPLSMTIRETIIHAGVLAAINPANPHQYEFWHDLVLLMCDKPRDGLEMSGPGGGPIRSEVTGAESLSAEEMAQRMVRATKIAQAVLEQQNRNQPPDLRDAIEVTATETLPPEKPAGNATFEAMPSPAAAPAPSPSRQQPEPPRPPNVGLIPTTRK